jgi:hypothetical protein
MSKTIETKFRIESWDEKPYRELADGSKFTRADVVLTGTGDELGAATFEALMFYPPDGTSSYVTLMHVTAVLDGRSGSFVLRGDGTYEDGIARAASVVVPGSGTGELAGLTGRGNSVSTHSDYPYMPFTLEYDVE